MYSFVSGGVAGSCLPAMTSVGALIFAKSSRWSMSRTAAPLAGFCRSGLASGGRIPTPSSVTIEHHGWEGWPSSMLQEGGATGLAGRV
jgi:hypothetical protein